MIKLTTQSFKKLFIVVLFNATLITMLIMSQFSFIIPYTIIIQLIYLCYYLHNKSNKLSTKIENESSLSQLTFNAMNADYNRKVEEVKLTMDELNTAYEELELLNVKMVKSQKELQEISDYRGKFLINMSHELRTPLNAIIGFTSIMRSSGYTIEAEEHSEMVDIIHKSSNKLLGMINNILELTKIETQNLEPSPSIIDIIPSLELAASMVKGMLSDKPKILFNINIQEDFPHVYCDAKALDKTLLQILDNAVKYTERGEIDLSTSYDDTNAYIHIKDTGCGIDANDREDLFQPFISMLKENNPTEKTGIGLAISKYLMDQIDAEILINSTIGHGTTVTIKLKRG